MGITSNTGVDNLTTTTYSNWSANKGETGDQGYGITTIDVVLFWSRGQDSSNDFDANEIDWTELSEIAIPTGPVIDTPWTKALDFSGGSEYANMLSTNTDQVGALRLSGGLSIVPPHSTDITKTSNNTNCRSWACCIVFKADRNNSTQHIWNSGEGITSTNDNIYLKLDTAGGLYFGWGRSTEINECMIGSSNFINSSDSYGVYIAHKGPRFSAIDATASNLQDAFDIRVMSSSDLFTSIGTNLSTISNWTSGSVGARMDRPVQGTFSIGGKTIHNLFYGKIASMVVTTLKINADVPTDLEIKTMITDPIKWVTDNKVGYTFRFSDNFTVSTNDIMNDNNYGKYATQVWLMGDGVNDSFSNGIRNYIKTDDNTHTKLQLNSMQSNDIETITIPGLT